MVKKSETKGMPLLVAAIMLLVIMPAPSNAESGDPITFTNNLADDIEPYLATPNDLIADADSTGQVQIAAHGTTYTLDANDLDMESPTGTVAFVEDEILSTVTSDPAIGTVRTFQVSLTSYSAGSGILTLSPTFIALLVEKGPCEDLVIEMIQSNNALTEDIPTMIYDQTYGDLSSAHCTPILGPSTSSSSSYSTETLEEIIMDADASFYAEHGSNTWSRQRHFLGLAYDKVFDQYNIEFKVTEQWAWSRGGPDADRCSDFVDEVKVHWRNYHASTSRDGVYMLRGDQFLEGSSGYKRFGCQDYIGGLKDPDKFGYVATRDVKGHQTSTYRTLAHEIAHQLNAKHSKAFVTSSYCKSSSGTSYDHATITKDGHPASCKLNRFSTASETGIYSRNNEYRVRRCVEDRDPGTCDRYVNSGSV